MTTFRESYYLTWKDMSTQLGILNVISSTKLWTGLSKEQYLPPYFKEICDNYCSIRRCAPNISCGGRFNGQYIIMYLVIDVYAHKLSHFKQKIWK